MSSGNHFPKILRTIALFSIVIFLSPWPAMAANRISCGPGDVRYEIDLNAIALKYEGQSFTAVLDGLNAILKARISVDRKMLQQVADATQHWNEFLKALVVGFNSCAITKAQYAEALRSYPQLKTQAAELEKILNLLTQGRQLDEKRLQDTLKRYFASLHKLVLLAGQEQILKHLQAMKTSVETGQEEIIKRLDQIDQRIRSSLPDRNLPEKDLEPEFNEVHEKLTSLSEKVMKEYVEGKNNHNEGKFETAISHFTNAIDLSPKIPSLYLVLGNSYLAYDRYDDAIATYDRGLAVAERSEMIYAKLIANRGHANEELGQHQNAMDDLSLAIKLIPNHSGTYIARGVVKYRMKDFQGAIDDYTAAMERDSDSANAYYNRGLAKANLKDFQGAIKDFTKSIKLSPDHDDVYHSRGVVKV